MDIVLLVFRYTFLIILYIFIIQLTRMMLRDLREGGREAPEPVKRASGNRLRETAFQEPAPVPGAAAGLVVVSSGDPGLPGGRVFPLRENGQASIGRGGHNTIILVEPFASVDHAVVSGSEGQYWLEDRGSKNGTFLNEVRINKPTVLADGDRIRIGDVTIQFVRWTYEVESGDGSRFGKKA